MTRTTLSDPHAPEPVGPYSHAALGAHGTLYLSGQTPIDASTGRLVDGDVAVQTRRVFENLAFVLSAAGRTLDDVIKVNVYLVDMQDFAAMNSVYSTFFSAPYPARTTVAVAGLPLGARVEIELIASAEVH